MDNSDDQYPDEAYIDLCKLMDAIAEKLRKIAGCCNPV